MSRNFGISFYTIPAYDAETDGPVLGGFQPPARPPVAVGASRDPSQIQSASPSSPGGVWPNSGGDDGSHRQLFIHDPREAAAFFFVGAMLSAIGFVLFALMFFGFALVDFG